MNKIRKTILGVLFPVFCFAHGEEAIYYIFSELIILILIASVILFLKISWKKKIILNLVLILTYPLSFLLVNLPFRNNVIVIVIIQFLFVIASIILTYNMFLKEK